MYRKRIDTDTRRVAADFISFVLCPAFYNAFLFYYFILFGFHLVYTACVSFPIPIPISIARVTARVAMMMMVMND